MTGLCQDKYKSQPVVFLYPKTKDVELITNQPLAVPGKPHGLGFSVLFGSGLYSWWITHKRAQKALAHCLQHTVSSRPAQFVVESEIVVQTQDQPMQLPQDGCGIPPRYMPVRVRVYCQIRSPLSGPINLSFAWFPGDYSPMDSSPAFCYIEVWRWK